MTMPKSSTPSFITEIKLKVDQNQERTLLVRLDTARQMYNACLGEALGRLDTMRNSAVYQQARALPKLIKDKPGRPLGQDRKALFQAARDDHEFNEYSLHAYAGQIRHSWLGEHLDSLTVQKVATRAFKAVFRYSIGQAGKPRFKG